MKTHEVAPGSLAGRVQQPDYVGTITELTLRVHDAQDVASVHRCFTDGVRALGAERAWFASVEIEGDSVLALALQSACDASWTRRYLDDELYRYDPWLAYAQRHAEPVPVSQLLEPTGRAAVTRRLALEAGLVSCALIPAHGDALPGRFGLLVLGHSSPDYFDDDGFALLRICSRTFALELHGWWLAQRRRERRAEIHLNDDDRMLLEMHAQGRNSDQIAAVLQVTRQSINSRFQRLNRKLKAPNRRAALQVAVDCGLIRGA